MPAPQNPAMVQWQLRFDQAMQASQSASSPEARRAAAEKLRQLQMSKPTGPAPTAQGRLRSEPKPAPTQSSGGPLGPVFNYIRNAMDRSNGK